MASIDVAYGFVAGSLTVCGVWIFFQLAKKLWVKDAIEEIKKDEKKKGLDNDKALANSMDKMA